MQESDSVQLDLRDLQRRVGQEVGGGELIEPCSATDIRRWVMAMDYPNRVHPLFQHVVSRTGLHR
jgi:Ni,Fe-hydrogenase III component G